MSFPLGLTEIIAHYGDYTPFLRSDYTVTPTWERAILATCWLPIPMRLGWIPPGATQPPEVYKIRMHKLCCDSASGVFARIAKANLWPEMKTFDGCYNWRPKKTDNSKLSAHCWGIAIDINAATNKLGTKGDMAPGIVELFEAEGWEWGGRWAHPDPMHFQACKGY